MHKLSRIIQEKGLENKVKQNLKKALAEQRNQNDLQALNVDERVRLLKESFKK
ncbi:MAG: hypothetical protein CFH43_00844 [Proteobacteria bacterium]|nr:MAG: hypothetical protein CFH43_00844 [Pseudomonadota bacterium]|tara:strand:- start:103 stop:261 length:159 start_codon:yes stop_codon:yes gene_type:complete